VAVEVCVPEKEVSECLHVPGRGVVAALGLNVVAGLCAQVGIDAVVTRVVEAGVQDVSFPIPVGELKEVLNGRDLDENTVAELCRLIDTKLPCASRLVLW
jgi:hypothetical protein